MGRQAFLTKIALGRSAFEPSQTITHTSEYIQLASSQREVPSEARDAAGGKYIQLYDERGNPINPRAHDQGRRLREAQNDVLAAIGVLERRRSPSQHLPGSYKERLQLLDDEDAAGSAIAFASTLSENVCTWWLGSLRERIYTFRFDDALSFSRIVDNERAVSGKSLLNTGFTARLLRTLSIQAINIFSPLDKLILYRQTSAATKRSYRRWRGVTSFCLRITLELLFYPLAYHSYLQRLGLVPARPLLPPAKTFIPFTDSSPLLPFSLHYDASASTLHFLKAVLTSPFVFICVEHFYEWWAYSAVNEAVETAMIQPTNPDLPSPDDGTKARKNAVLGLRAKSPPLVRDAINTLLTCVGWRECRSTPSEKVTKQSANDPPQMHNTIEVDGSQVVDLARLDIPLAHQGAQGPLGDEDNVEVTIPVAPLNEVVPPPDSAWAPPSPTASQTSRENNDPRIRITSREGIVEMEVRLPPQVLSSHTEMAGSDGLVDQYETGASIPSRAPGTQPYHRVTQLSAEPAQMIGAIVKAQIVGWATLPLKVVTRRLVAAHFLAGRGGYVGPRRVLDPFPAMSELSWSSVGVQVSRIALCGVLELAIDLGLWGVQYLTVAYTGANSFGWGTL